MRWIIQLFAMLGDLHLLVFSGIALYLYWDVFPANLLVIFLVVKCFNGWRETGGFQAWNPESVGSFMMNMRKIGF